MNPVIAKIPFQNEDGVWAGEATPSEIVAAAGNGLPYLEAEITDDSLAANQHSAVPVVNLEVQRGANSLHDAGIFQITSSDDLGIAGDPLQLVRFLERGLVFVRGVVFLKSGDDMTSIGLVNVGQIRPPYNDPSAFVDTFMIGATALGDNQQFIDGTTLLRVEPDDVLIFGMFAPASSDYSIGTSIPLGNKRAARLELTALAAIPHDI